MVLQKKISPFCLSEAILTFNTFISEVQLQVHIDAKQGTLAISLSFSIIIIC